MMAMDLRVSTWAVLMSGAVAIAVVGCGSSTETTSAPTPSDSPVASETAPTAPPTGTADSNAGSESVDAPPSETAAPAPAPQPEANDTAPQNPPNPVIAGKKDCGEMANQLEMNLCAGENYALSDAKLNEIYQYVQSNLDSTAKSKLETAEQAWIKFRDGQCEFERSGFEGGSIAPLIFHTCMEQMTDIRIDELNQASPAEASFETADQQLNQVYQDLQAVAPDGSGDLVRDVQLDWLKYRDANCEFESTHAAIIMSERQCMARMTEIRTQQLQVQLDQWSL